MRNQESITDGGSEASEPEQILSRPSYGILPRGETLTTNNSNLGNAIEGLRTFDGGRKPGNFEDCVLVARKSRGRARRSTQTRRGLDRGETKPAEETAGTRVSPVLRFTLEAQATLDQSIEGCATRQT